MEQNYFELLASVDCKDKIEKKNNLSYLSWAWAWSELKKRFPDAAYTIYEDAEGRFYHTDGRTCWVKTGVAVNGLEHIEYLPVMDFKNKSIPLEQVTSFDANKAIQRSLTKAVARHGLGLYIYAGEDLPENPAGDAGEPVGEVEMETLKKVVKALGGTTTSDFKRITGVALGGLPGMTKPQWGVLMAQLNRQMDAAQHDAAMGGDGA